jgi:hypothetical protein
MKPEILRKYPLVKKCLQEERDMFGAPEPALKRQQERAVELIDAEGGGSPEEKEASMICAILMLNPMSLYANIGRFWEGYTEEVSNSVQAMLSTAPDSFLPVAIAQATAAVGVTQMEQVAKELKADRLSAPPEQTLEGVKKAFGQELDNFAYLDAPELLARFDETRTALFSALEAKITPPEIDPRIDLSKRRKPPNGDFSF